MNAQWIYDKSLNHLMVIPHFSEWSLASQQMWYRMLRSLNLHHWLSYFEGKSSELVVHSFVFDISTIAELKVHLQPYSIWIFGQKLENELYSPHPDQICSSPILKKDVWKQWLSILVK